MNEYLLIILLILIHHFLCKYIFLLKCITFSDFMISMTYMPIRHQLGVEIKPQTDYEFLHDLQMYSIPPSGQIKLEELQQWCVDRLRELVNNGLYDFAKLVRAYNYKSQGETEQRLRRNDCMSHLILRSAFSFEREKRKWFFKQEVKLFKWRLSLLNKDGIKAFNCVNGLQHAAISEEEKHKIIEHVKISCHETENIDNINVYKVHFTSIINPIMKRQIFLKNGIAYVPETKISWLILPEFKKNLNKGFSYSREIASNVHGDERLMKIFSVLPSCINIRYFKYDRYRKVSIGELDELSRTSYPMCMKLLHETLKANHHLTNGGRVQYCLFLKGIGLSLNNAIQFWKNEFTKKIDENTFRKKYRYHIRHLFGKEGKRANYEPFDCFKILNSTVGLRDNHGCPFKWMKFDTLKNVLSKCGLVRSDIESVALLSKEGFYLEACKKYYEITHNCITENTFGHPNVYFNDSCKRFENMFSASSMILLIL
ncbi:DNA primase large subunit isoform X3 [Ptiloglossa arizonensis]|uniref:DNA primase large subunit isoform X3 n=1 Tax=Ptiloglossa arizonensis TaxID=3350558 RepID=UPI003F9EF8FF